ncbi:MAG: hypothetical protein GTN53_22945 [Candidatus Aminicenantes bacterium]|nr:hypothetical protein [Candidatus Aminicenantes bacterium]NIQ69361.1 hypothetical protein [Candidatus Aminicenantes bacterium]NIT25362.1 hypothetical protein [Candidatus Aminicenantes bacterium]
MRVKSVIIGEQAFDHKITVVGDQGDPDQIAREFLKRQYPKRFDEMIDIEGNYE